MITIFELNENKHFQNLFFSFLNYEPRFCLLVLFQDTFWNILKRFIVMRIP